MSTTTETLIHGKIARVLNSRELVINRGAADGVREGMYFDILDPQAEEIRDPDSGDVLGSLLRPKVRVRVVHVDDRFSVASTYRSQKVNVGGTGAFSGPSSIARHLLPPRWVKKYETLKTEEKTWEPIDEEQCYVRTGDPVRQVFDDEDETGLATASLLEQTN
jgi:hypothetical protein